MKKFRCKAEKQRKKISQGSVNKAAAFIVIMYIITLPGAAAAYVGPGAGISMIGALWAVILAVLFTVIGLLLWPIRAIMRRRKQTDSPPEKKEAEVDKGNGV